MKKSLPSAEDSTSLRASIIGLGESSFRKNHFPALQKKLSDLEYINNQYKTLIETIPDILLVGKGETLAVFTSSSIAEAELAEEMLADPGVSAMLRKAAEASKRDKKLVTINFRFLRQEKPAYFEARVNTSGENEYLIIIRDMTAEAELHIKLREMALGDKMTGLHNRGYFEEQLLQFSRRSCRNLSVILIDVDGLKIVNDALGHLYGDQMLVAIADILKDIFSFANCIARIGGDEFGILLDGCDQKRIELLLLQMNQAILDYNQDQTLLKLSVSFGYSYLRDGSADMEMLFRDADNKMYQNKLLKENSNRSSIVKTLMKTLEMKDFITEGHAVRMEKHAVEIGKILQLPQDRLDRIVLLTKFHDIGKVGIPDSILMKPGRLTEQEWEIMQSHSSIGKRIAETSPELFDIAQLILLHHERWDGTGYPFGLKKRDIPVECRVLSIVDAFDAMTNDRPYRKARPVQEAVREIAHCAGTQFDEELTKIFFRVIDEEAKHRGEQNALRA
jgi:diguanylate cyclase (GGDEF)-like protein